MDAESARNPDQNHVFRPPRYFRYTCSMSGDKNVLLMPNAKSVAVLVALALIGLGGCGRRGALEPPPEAGVNARQAREAEKARSETASETLEVNRRVRNVVPSREPFILDPLL